jgi:hypothetical protein
VSDDKWIPKVRQGVLFLHRRGRIKRRKDGRVETALTVKWGKVKGKDE